MPARPTTEAALVVLSCLAACSGGGHGFRQPAAFTDLNPDPDIVEVQIVAGPATVEYLKDTPAAVWAYRDGAVAGSVGTVPGPLLQAKQGDLVLVHFRNELPESTTIHWHGLRLPASQDGTTAVQTAVRPGETFDYRFTAGDAGSFWFHPHVNADKQVEKGLYAPMIVTGGPPVDVAADRVLVLDDIKLQADGQLDDTPSVQDFLWGRQGTLLLVNGESGQRIPVAAGTRERWRLINAANGRYFNLSLPGHTFLVIGWDGGLLPAPYTTDTLLIAPGERYEVLLTFDQLPMDHLTLQTMYYDRGQGPPDPGPMDLLGVVYGSAGPTPAPLPASWRALDRLPVDGSTPVRSFTLTQQDSPAGPQFLINGERWPFNMPLPVRQGDLEIWEVIGNQDMDHPFHLHGMFFEVLSVGGVAFPQLGWKDTVNVPKAQSVRFAVRYDPPGSWMFHCSIFEHSERGMMGELAIK